MLSINEAIKHAEEVATEQERLMGRYDAASGYARSGIEAIRTESAKKCEKCAAEHRQLAEWLRELQERRKAPEIVRCKSCQYFGIEGHELYCRMWQSYTAENGYCHLAEKAERRTDEVRTP